MPNERDEGLAALQNRDLQTAQAKLETAIQQDPSDGLAHLYLGGVYHQQGRHLDAVQTLTRAAELQPANPQARYNLGIVLEHLGATDQAQAAYQQALALQPDYPLAQQGLARMQQAAPAAPSYAPGYAPAQPTAAPMNAAQSASGYAPAPPAYQAPAYQPEQTQAAPPTQQPAYGQPNYAQPSAYGQPQQPAYGQAMNQPTDLAGNPLPNAQPADGQPPMGYAPPPGASGPLGYQGPQWTPQAMQGPLAREDVFSLKQSFSDLFRLLTAPREFFAEEEGANGFSSPLSMILVYSLLFGLIYCIAVILMGVSAGPGAFIALFLVLLVIPVGYVIYAFVGLIGAGLVYGVSRLFGSQGTYAGAYRAVVYCWAPMVALGMIGGVINAATMHKPNLSAMSTPQGQIIRAQYGRSPVTSRPSTPGGFGETSYSRTGQVGFGANAFQQNPIAMLLNLIGFFWGAVLLVMGVRATQRMSTGGAAGTVVISAVITVAIFIGLFVALSGAILAAAMHSTG